MPEPLTGAEPSVFAPSLNTTVPVGVPMTVTVAVNVIGVPYATEGDPELARAVDEPGPVKTFRMPVPVNRLSVCCAPDAGEPHVPAALNVAPPSKDSAVMVLGVPVNARFTTGAAPTSNRLAEDA